MVTVLVVDTKYLKSTINSIAIVQDQKYYRMNKEQLDEGILTCFEKAMLLSKDALVLIENNGEDIHSTGLFSLAIEEYGKALLLRDHFNNKKAEYQIPTSIFGKRKGSHTLKINRALENLPNECKAIFVTADKTTKSLSRQIVSYRNIAIEVTGSGGISMKNAIDSLLRFECFYTDWNEDYKHWNMKLKIWQKERFVCSIKIFQNHLESILRG